MLLQHAALILWQAVGLTVALHLLILFHFVVVLRPFRGKVAPKGHTPFKIYSIQTSHLPENKPFHSQQGWKVSDSPPEYILQKIQEFYTVVFMLICFHYVFALVFMALLTVPVATLSLNWLLGSYLQYVACTDSSLALRLYLFISAQVIKSCIKPKWDGHFCGICRPKWQSLGVGEEGGKEDWFDACETPQENQYAHRNPRLT